MEAHIHITPGPRDRELMAAVIASLKAGCAPAGNTAGLATKDDLKRLERRLMDKIDELLEKIRENRTVLGGLNTLFDGLRARFDEILRGAPALQAKIAAALDEATAHGTELAEVVLENTPSEPPSPSP